MPLNDEAGTHKSITRRDQTTCANKTACARCVPKRLQLIEKINFSVLSIIGATENLCD